MLNKQQCGDKTIIFRHYSRSVKRKHDSEELSEDGFLEDIADISHGQHSVSQNQSSYSAVLLSGGINTVKTIQGEKSATKFIFYRQRIWFIGR